MCVCVCVCVCLQVFARRRWSTLRQAWLGAVVRARDERVVWLTEMRRGRRLCPGGSEGGVGAGVVDHAAPQGAVAPVGDTS